MQKDKPMVITINREYGAGGRTVAKALSEALGIPWYDLDFVTLTAQKSGYSEEEVQVNSEGLTIKTDLANRIFSNASYTSTQDSVFRAQRKVMIELAASPCIIVGRESNYIYRDAGIPSFDIFLYADMDYKVKRARELGEHGSTDPKKYVEEQTALRQHHYKHYAKNSFGDYHDYDISLNISKIGTERACRMLVEMLTEIMK